MINLPARRTEAKVADVELAPVLYALSHPTRLKIVPSLSRAKEIACSYFDIDMSKSSDSHDLLVLRSAGVMPSRNEGTELMNALRRADLARRCSGS